MISRITGHHKLFATVLMGLLGLLHGQAGAAGKPRAIVLGFDGADPRTVTRYMEEGKLPNLAKLRDQGTFAPLGTTRPAESPVAWAAFATGMNPGKTRIFDFLYRVPGTYVPDIALAEEGTEPLIPETSLRVSLALGLGGLGFALVFLVLGVFLKIKRGVSLGVSGASGVLLFGAALYAILNYVPREVPKAIARRGGVSFWKYTTQNGVKTVALEAPVTFPAEDLPGGKLLTGLGTPDIKKTWGTWFLFTSDAIAEESTETNGQIVPLDFVDGTAKTVLRGPRNFTLPQKNPPEVTIPLRFDLNPEDQSLTIEAPGKTLRLRHGEWSDWVEVSFKLNPLIAVHGMTRFCLLSLEPNVQVYAEPLNWNPKKLPPTVAISYPHGYAAELADAIGPYETIGWMTATNPLKDEAIGYDAFMADLDFAIANGRKMLFHELGQPDWQCLVSVFLFTDRAQHMLFRFVDPEHPMYDAELAKKYAPGIEKVYVEMDKIVGEVMAKHVDADTTLLVVSDHGMHSFRKGVNLNTWLAKNGYLALTGAGDARRVQDLFDPDAKLFSNVDWSRSKAYALGLSGIYINVAGREPRGIVAPGAEYEAVKKQIIEDLQKLTDPATGKRVVRAVQRREDIFKGPFMDEAYDLEVAFEPGYRVSWQTTLGGTPPDVIELNKNNWSGDHCSMDSELTRGIFFSNRKLKKVAPSILDIGPTVLKIFGIPVPGDMDGEPVF